MKYIKLNPLHNKVLVNINSLRTFTRSIYIKPEFEANWIQLDTKDVEAFIAETKAQKEAEATQVKTTKVKTE